MRSTTKAALAALAASLVFTTPPAEAGQKGLTRKQVKQIRSITRQEIARAVQDGRVGPPGPQGPAGTPGTGPAGPQGPAGPPGNDASGGFDIRFAHLNSAFVVDAENSRGISQENITKVEIEDGPQQGLDVTCIVGLPPPLAGQLTVDWSRFVDDGARFEAGELELTDDGACIIINQPNPDVDPAGFHILLIY